MAARELNTYVHVSDEAGEAHVFGPGDKVPGWAAEKIGDHCFEGGKKSSGNAPKQSADTNTPPPKAGAGSGKEAWATYAAAQEVEVPEDASRDEIIAALEAAGKPVEA